MRVVTGALCLAVPVLAACGNGTTTHGPDPGTPGPDAPLPTTTAARAGVATTTTARSSPLGLAGPQPTTQRPGDPCAGTPRERLRRRARERRRHMGHGICFDDQPDTTVAGRHERLSIVGTTTRLHSFVRRATVPNPDGGDVLRPSATDGVFFVARLTVTNRRSRALTLPRGSITYGYRGAVGPTFLWSVAEPGKPFGRNRPEVRIPAHASRTVRAVWEGSTSATGSGTRVLVSIPDPPGAPEHPKQPLLKSSSGVIDLDR